MSDLRDQLAGAVEAFDELQGISGGYKARALAAEAEVSRLAAALGVSASADGPPDLADCRWTSSCSSVSTCLNRGALVTDLVTRVGRWLKRALLDIWEGEKTGWSAIADAIVSHPFLAVVAVEGALLLWLI